MHVLSFYVSIIFLSSKHSSSGCSEQSKQFTHARISYFYTSMLRFHFLWSFPLILFSYSQAKVNFLSLFPWKHSRRFQPCMFWCCGLFVILLFIDFSFFLSGYTSVHITHLTESREKEKEKEREAFSFIFFIITMTAVMIELFFIFY